MKSAPARPTIRSSPRVPSSWFCAATPQQPVVAGAPERILDPPDGVVLSSCTAERRRVPEVESDAPATPLVADRVASAAAAVEAVAAVSGIGKWHSGWAKCDPRERRREERSQVAAQESGGVEAS